MGFQEILEWEHLPYAVAGLAVAVSIPVVLKIKGGLDRKKKRDAYPADTVILHQIGRGPWAPSLSPFPLKLETYLRFAKIPYQNDHGFEFSSKGKTPWITYNGEDVADSGFIIEFLNEKRGVDLSSHLSEEEKAIARAFQKMAEENLYWLVDYCRFLENDNKNFLQKDAGMSAFVRVCLTRAVKRQLWHQGIGRHSPQEVQHLFNRDLQALSHYLSMLLVELRRCVL